MTAEVLVVAGTYTEPVRVLAEEGRTIGGDAQLLIDRELLACVQAGDPKALARIYDKYSRLVYSVALRILRDTGRAEDVLQEVFLTLWRRPELFCAKRGALAPWLSVIARNRAIDVLRRRPNHEDISELQVETPIDIGAEVETSVLADRVRQLLPKIPAEQLEALDMAFFQGMTHAEIAALTGLPLGTIKSRIRSALQILGRGLRQTRCAEA